MVNIVTHVTSIFKKYIQRGKMSILFYCSGVKDIMNQSKYHVYMKKSMLQTGVKWWSV